MCFSFPCGFQFHDPRQHTCLHFYTITLWFSISRFNSNIIPWRHLRGVASQITDNSTVCLEACSGYSQTKHQGSASLTLCEGNPSLTDGFPSQMVSNAGSVSMSWCNHHTYGTTSLLSMMASSNGDIFRVTGTRVRAIHQSPVDSPHQGQWRRALIFSLIYAWTNGWANNRDTGDLRRYCAHYDVTVMQFIIVIDTNCD